jgi:hypothetical protein
MKKLLAGLATALLASGFAVVAGIAPASAQAPSVSGSAACQVDGTYTVTWNYSVSNVPNGVTATASVTASSPAGTISGGGTTTTTSTFTQSGLSGAATEAAVTIQTLWSDGASESTPASVPLAAGCAVVPAPVVETPAVEAPVVEAPVVETPAVETPAVETPATDEPADTTEEPADTTTEPTTEAPAETPAELPGDTATSPSTEIDLGEAGIGEPTCISDDEISYVYDEATNSGVVTVGTNAESRGPGSTGELCEPLYVTATSWLSASETFPESGDVADLFPLQLLEANALPEITAAGEYPFGAPVACGKGIIYASHEPLTDIPEYLESEEIPQPTWLEDLIQGYGPSWNFSDEGCDVALVAAAALPQTCDPLDPTSPLDGSLVFLLNDAVTYSVDGVDVTEEILTVEPGTYTVTITANPGYTYVGEPELELVVEAADCELPVFAVWDANASAVSEQCPPSGTTPTPGYIDVVFPEGAESAVQYFLGGTELTASRTEVEPGTYTVTAVPRVPEDSILGDTTWTLTVTSATCALPTLAATGTDTASGLGIGAGLLMLGGTLTLMRRSRTRTED